MTRLYLYFTLLASKRQNQHDERTPIETDDHKNRLAREFRREMKRNEWKGNEGEETSGQVIRREGVKGCIGIGDLLALFGLTSDRRYLLGFYYTSLRANISWSF